MRLLTKHNLKHADVLLNASAVDAGELKGRNSSKNKSRKKVEILQIPKAGLKVVWRLRILIKNKIIILRRGPQGCGIAGGRRATTGRVDA
jgi:hypothetical protein